MNKMFRQKMFRRFLFSYLFVLILPLLATGLIMMNYTSRVLTEEAKQSSYQNLVQSKLLADREFSELREIAIQIGRNQDIRKVMFEQDHVELQYARWRALSELSLTNLSKKFPDEIQVYFQRTEEFLNATSYYNAGLFYQKYPIDGMDAQEFVHWVSDNEQMFSSLTARNGQTRYLLYSSGIPVGETKGNGAVLMFINWEKLRSLFSASIGVGVEKYDFILSTDGGLLYSSAPDGELYLPALVSVIQGGKSLTEQKIEGKRYLVAFVVSDEVPLCYLSITAIGDALASVGAMRVNLAVTFGVCLLFGVVFLFLLTQRNYRPIQNLFDYVESGSRKEYRKAYDEFGEIVDKMDEMFSENRLLEQSVQRQLPNIRMSFISNLLAGRYPDSKAIQPLEEMLDIRFESSQFCVIITRIEDYSGFTPEQDEKNLSLVNFAVTNVMLELLEEFAFALELPVRKQQTFLLCFREGVENPQEKMEKCLEQFHEFVTHILNIQISVGAGTVCQGIDAIPRCNEDAQTALNQRFLYGQGCVSIYSPADLAQGNRYYYPIDKETQLINRMKQGNTEEAMEIADHLFEENISQRRIPLQLCYCMMFNMLGTVLKVLNDTGLEYDVSELVAGMLQAMLHHEDILQLRQQLSEAVKVICSQVQANRESGNIHLKSRIAQYLEENYMDSNLSLQWIADQFHLSGPYLSRYFKDQMGMNFADYLCRLRIAQAKELMKDSSFSIQEISARVGYNSSNSFIRTFKRYESVTPGQFRETLDDVKFR